jgi:hypothetical protein
MVSLTTNKSPLPKSNIPLVRLSKAIAITSRVEYKMQVINFAVIISNLEAVLVSINRNVPAEVSPAIKSPLTNAIKNGICISNAVRIT